MISHVTLGTSNLKIAEQFYDQLLLLMNVRKVAKTKDVVFYEFPDSPTRLAITRPYDRSAATSGNGTMLALKVKSEELVKEIHELAMKLNSTCEGKPGPRNDCAFFAAYFRDLDGHKIAVFHRH